MERITQRFNPLYRIYLLIEMTEYTSAQPGSNDSDDPGQTDQPSDSRFQRNGKSYMPKLPEFSHPIALMETKNDKTGSIKSKMVGSKNSGV